MTDASGASLVPSTIPLVTAVPTVMAGVNPMSSQQLYFARKLFEQEYKQAMKSFRIQSKAKPSETYVDQSENKRGVNFSVLDSQKSVSKLLHDAFSRLSPQEKSNLFQDYARFVGLGQL